MLQSFPWPSEEHLKAQCPTSGIIHNFLLIQRIPELYFLISLLLLVHFPSPPSHIAVLAFSCM